MYGIVLGPDIMADDSGYAGILPILALLSRLP